MAKKVDLKAKAKRQKIIAAVGGLLLVGLLAVQVPRTMRMLNPPAPPPPPPAAAPTNVPSDPSVLPTPGSVGGAAASSGAGEAVLVDSDPTPAPSAGQLETFSLFDSKDPFQQQITGRPGGSGGTDDTPPAGEAPEPEDAPAPGAVGSSPGGGGGSEKPPATTPARSATIAVNGVEEVVAVGAAFPASEPVFKLVSIKNGEARIAIAGGAFASGEGTVALVKGKPLTLVNTADGTRYELKLISVG